MRVLVANIPLPENRFLVDLNSALQQRCHIEQSSDKFWNMTGGFDVVHLHFPHYLTYEAERASQTSLSDELIREVELRLRFWSHRARIVVTRHVLLPHDALADSPWEKMYELVYSYADGVVHFVKASVDEFRNRYRETTFIRGIEPDHAVIPHQNYTSLPNVVNRSEARKRLGLPESAKVMLVFGAIRSDEERDLVLNTFKRLEIPRKVLLVSKWREQLSRVAWIRLKYWIRDAVRLFYHLHPSYHFNYSFVAENDTQLYLNAADVLFIPRFKVLNSGNVTLGFTFGRVVVGPDSWDVGEVLRETGNPVFDPENIDTAVDAVTAAFRIAEQGKVGQSNKILALSEWSTQRCASAYVTFFNRLRSTEIDTTLTAFDSRA